MSVQQAPWRGIVDGPSIGEDDPIGAFTVQRAANNILHWHDQSAQVIASGYGAPWMTIDFNANTVRTAPGQPMFPQIGPFSLRVRPDGQSFRIRLKLRAYASAANVRLRVLLASRDEFPALVPLAEIGEGTGRAYWNLPTSDPGTWLSDPIIDGTSLATADHIYRTSAVDLAAPLPTQKELGGESDTLFAPLTVLWLALDTGVNTSVTVVDFYAAEVAG